MTTEEKLLFIKWVTMNINNSIVPPDEGNTEGLIFNLIQLIIGSEERWCYEEEQKENVEEWIRSEGENLPGLYL